MFLQNEAFAFGHHLLAFLNFGVEKLFHPSAVKANQVVVVLALVKFVNRFARFEVAPAEKARLFELHQHPVDRGQADVGLAVQQHAVDIFRRHMTLFGILEHFQNLQAWQRGLESGALEFVDIGHGGLGEAALGPTAAARIRCGGLPGRDPGATMKHHIVSVLQGRFLLRNTPVLRPLQVACMHQLFSRPLPLFPATRRLARPLPLGLAVLALTALSACSSVRDKLPSVGSVVTPYKIDIVQGNVVTREQAQALRPGMAREQVRDLLGSPLLTSVFHADRWDYVFTFRRQGQPTQSRRLTVFFKDAALERFESDELPSEAEFVPSLDSSRKPGKLPPLEATEAQLKAFEASNAVASEASTTPPAVAPATSYPPLEAPGEAK